MSQAGTGADTDIVLQPTQGPMIRLGGDEAAFLALRHARLAQKWQKPRKEPGSAPPEGRHDGARPRCTSFDCLSPRGPEGGPVWRGQKCIETHYDTPEQHLFHNNACLRLDQMGDTLVQYYRHMAKESTIPLPVAGHFLKKFSGADSSLYGLKRKLSPFLRLAYQRYDCDILFGTTGIGLQVQQGRIEAWAPRYALKERPFQTVLLTYQGGSPGGLYEFARALTEECGLYVDAYSPEAQGRALAYGTALPRRPSRPDFTTDDNTSPTVEDVITRALTSALHQIEDGYSLLMADDPAGVKVARIGLRRIRALERAFRPALGCEKLAHFSARAKAFARELGEVRDLEVLACTALPDIIRRASPAEAEAVALRALEDRARAQYHEKWQRLDAMMRRPAFTGFLISLAQYCGARGWRESLPDRKRPRLVARKIHKFSARILDRQLAKAQDVGATLDKSPIDASHPLRIEVKKLRYAAQALRGFYDRQARSSYMQALSRLQDIFGAMNDAQVTLALGKSLIEKTTAQPEDPPPQSGQALQFLSGWYARDLEDHAQGVYDAWQALEAIPPFWRD